MNPIRKNFLVACRLASKHRRLVSLMFFVMLISFLVGVIFPHAFKATIDSIVNSLVDKILGKGFIEITSFIILNNLKSALFVLLLGFTVIVPFFSATVNGFIIGIVAMDKMTEAGPLVFMKIIPHGIFEIPALCLSMAFGLRIGLALWIKAFGLRSKKKREGIVKSAFKEAFIVYIFLVVPLLVLAGLIEGFLIVLFR
ncbi:hypothetical protein COV93_05300 [Candidatus Woesearchaeota archaeon CG11_big_fil_rev_8_21_14_0_20_43_8]|nr:MAG: hypothetical protein COV93_05300 [Candidatus Woesearchaeota archaeon CG11_big_fil_rev_8_21_14_0_20_43_8]PIO07068.1 MAG: hypothetical protein COT47_01680 [Candidatus Woesearchaeota archaeon CG08_land_8_20_14_0_20_43_7]